jgi:type I restriction enzyme, S subunit
MSAPALRFNEFSGEWKSTRLGSFIVERTEISNDEYPIYSLTIENGVTPKTDRYEREHLVGDTDSAYKLVCRNDFALNPMNLRFGAIARHIGNISVRVSKYYNIFYCDESVSTSFFDVYFRTPLMIGYYDKMSTGSLVEKKRVHFSNFVNFKVPVPSLEEQTKIANFLTTVDEKLTQLTRKHDLLTQYKKGVMQQIFSQELRFKDDDGRDFAEWEEKRIGDLTGKITAGATPSTLNKKFWGGTVRWMNSGELNLKRVFEVENRITVLGLSSSSTKLIPPKCVDWLSWSRKNAWDCGYEHG